MTGRDVVSAYLDSGYRIVVWPQIGDSKGPREEGWTTRKYTLDDYTEGNRVGLMTGVDINGKVLHDVDIDWQPGALIASKLLPPTGFIFGRASKKVSHLFYTCDAAIPSFRFEDIDKTCLLEIRGTKSNGEVGMQTMVPPSVWSPKGLSAPSKEQLEPLQFVAAGDPAHLPADELKKRAIYTAIALLLAKNLGKNGFGHEPRLMVAGFLLRLKIDAADVIAIGEAISPFCNNNEVHDVRTSVESTANALTDPKKKVKGGPALAKHFGINGKKIISLVNDWLGKSDDFARDKDGKILPKSQKNIQRAIELLGHELSYNQFSDKLLIDGQPMEDHIVEHVYLQIDTEHGFLPPWEFFKQVIRHGAWLNGFHPVKNYLDSLTWDGVPRIDEWLITTAKAEDSPYVRAVSSIMLIAAVRRIRQPGCKYDEMVVWESSKQGFGKSSAAQALCPNPAWFSDDLALNLRSQQVIEATLGKWIVEASDLAGKRKTEIEQLKAMLSRQVDGPARMAYAHFAVERPRHFIIIGTTNSQAYLTDPSGARRFWPITVQPFNVAWIKQHRDQLWAEACHREAAGESIRLHESLWPAAGEIQEKRREIDPWESAIYTCLVSIAPNSDGKRRVVTTALWDALGVSVERRDRAGALRITDIMQRFGFHRTKVRPKGQEVQAGFVQDGDFEIDSSDLVEHASSLFDKPEGGKATVL